MLAWINLWNFLVSCPHFHYCSGRLFVLCTRNKTTSIISRALFIHTIAQLQQTAQWYPCQVLCFLLFLNSALCALASTGPLVLTYNRCTFTEPWLKTHCKHPLPLAARLWMTKATICVILVESDLYLLCHKVDAGQNIAHTPTNFFQPCWLQV